MKFCEIELSLFSCTFKPVTLLPSIALIHVSSQRSSASASHQPLRPSQLPPPCSPQQPASPQRSTSRPCAARSAAASGIRCAGNRPYTLNQEPSSPSSTRHLSLTYGVVEVDGVCRVVSPHAFRCHRCWATESSMTRGMLLLSSISWVACRNLRYGTF